MKRSSNPLLQQPARIAGRAARKYISGANSPPQNPCCPMREAMRTREQRRNRGCQGNDRSAVQRADNSPWRSAPCVPNRTAKIT
eukprot:scaffold109257_cov34-Tisochrysis_lutea.AAC.5